MEWNWRRLRSLTVQTHHPLVNKGCRMKIEQERAAALTPVPSQESSKKKHLDDRDVREPTEAE